MDDGRLIAGFVLVGLTALGYVLQVRRQLGLNSDVESVAAFRSEFIEWFASRGQRADLYNRLIMNSPGVQSLVNATGELFVYKAPFRTPEAGFQTILNLIPEIASRIHDPFWAEQNTDKAKLVDETLLRLLGRADDATNRRRREMCNPLVEFREGVRAIASLPITVLQWFGLPIRFAWSGFVSGVTSAVLASIAFLSAVMTIVLGWEQFRAHVYDWVAPFAQNFSRD